MTRREERLGRGVIVVAVLALAACGVPGQAHADKIAPSEVPFGLIVSSTTTTTSAPVHAQSTIYLLRAGHLVGVDRQIPTDAAALVASLAEGPDATESAGGLRSAISDRDVVSGVTITDPLGTVDLSSHFSELPRGDQLLAVAQLVYTLTGIPEIRDVSFTLDGRPTAVPRGDGSLSDQPVDREDYRALTSPPS